MVATLYTVNTYVKRHLGGSRTFNTENKLGKLYIQHCIQAGKVVRSTLHTSWGSCTFNTAYKLGKSYIQYCIQAGEVVHSTLHTSWGSCTFNTAYKLGKSYIQHCIQAGEVVHSTLHTSWGSRTFNTAHKLGKSYIQHYIHLRKLYLQCRKKKGRIKQSKKKKYKEIKLIRQTWKRVTHPIPSLTKSCSSRLHTAVVCFH